MVRQSYTGLIDAVRDFEELRPLVQRLGEMQARCRPFKGDYHAIAIALSGIETAAYHFTGRPHFYSSEQRFVAPPSGPPRTEFDG